MRFLPAFKYPKPRRSPVQDVLHGVQIDDPYRWMEDPDSTATKAFVDEENAISQPFVTEQCSQRKEIDETLSAVYNYERLSAPRKVGDHYYYYRNTGLQSQPVLHRKSKLDDKSTEVFLDPNTLSDDGTVAVAGTYPSKGGQYYAYFVSKSGSDWNTIHVRKTADKKDLPDQLERVRYSNLAWTPDEKGFFYGSYPDWKGQTVTGTDAKEAKHQKIYYHRLGTKQSEDILVAEFPDHPDWLSGTSVSESGDKLIIETSPNLVSNMVFIADISPIVKERPTLTTIRGKLDSQLAYVTNDGDMYYWRTNIGRPNFAIVKFNINEPDKWEDVIPEDPKRALESIEVRGGDKFLVNYIQDVSTVVEVFDMKGKQLQKLPFSMGDIAVAGGERNSTEVFFQFVSFSNPTIIYKVNISDAPAAKLVEYKRTTLNSWSTDDLSYKQVFFKSADNTSVPMYILHRSDRQPNPSTPALLYAYGGFGVSLAPHFSLFNLMLVYTLGFVVSIANVRGGGEYGQQWHDAGRLEHKQNTLDDIHAAARFLIDNNFTSAANLTLTGRSNGGFVTLASINQRPELFGAAIAGVPVADLLRFHKFTIGHAWVSDYGNPDNATEFKFIRRVSPLHNIPQSLKNYPALLIQTADHDDRVVPSHSLKFIAELQHRAQQQQDGINSTKSLGETGQKNGTNQEGLRPFLALIDTKAGHGGGKPVDKQIADIADQMCFLKNSLDLTYDGSKFKAAVMDASKSHTN